MSANWSSLKAQPSLALPKATLPLEGWNTSSSSWSASGPRAPPSALRGQQAGAGGRGRKQSRPVSIRAQLLSQHSTVSAVTALRAGSRPSCDTSSCLEPQHRCACSTDTEPRQPNQRYCTLNDASTIHHTQDSARQDHAWLGHHAVLPLPAATLNAGSTCRPRHTSQLLTLPCLPRPAAAAAALLPALHLPPS